MSTAVATKARPIPDSHLDLLTRPVHAVLTTMGPDGQPQSSLVWVDVHDGVVIRLDEQAPVAQPIAAGGPKVLPAVT